MKRKFYFIAAILFLYATASAQQDTLGSKDLAEVIVSTGQYAPQSVKNSVYQVRVISQERIRLRGATQVQQVLNTELGFRFSSDNTLGTTDVQLMGMSGRNVKILLDGVPLVDRGDTRESLNQVDINSIDRIEIIEGPLSVSYGSDALAGVINLITKKAKANELSVIARLQEETAGSEYDPFQYKGVHSQSLGAAWQQKRWSFQAGGAHIDADGFGGDAYGRNKTWKPKEQWLGNARVGYAFENFSIYYRIDALNETITSRGAINTDSYRATDQRYTSNRYLHQLQGEWRITNALRWNSILAYTDYKRRTRTTRHDFVEGTDVLTNGEGEQDVSGVRSFVFRNTFQYRVSNQLSLQPGIELNREKANGARIKGSPSITDYALFVSGEWQPGNRINIRPGLRFIRNSVYDAPPVIPSLNTKFRLAADWDLRLAYAYGFRSPALRELYFDFHDANHNIIGNPDLKAEHSNSYSGSLTWTDHRHSEIRLSSVITGFYNQFRNLINYAVSATDPSLFITVNIDAYKTTGGTWENKLAWKRWDLGVGVSYIGQYNALSDDDKFRNEDLPGFVWSPEINANVAYTLKKTGTALGLFYKFTGSRPGYEAVATGGTTAVHLAHIHSFHWADLTLSQPLLRYLTLTAGIKNLFDVKQLTNTSATTGAVHGAAGAVDLSYGRSYFIGLAFQWRK